MVDAVRYSVLHPGTRLHEHQRITEQVLSDRPRTYRGGYSPVADQSLRSDAGNHQVNSELHCGHCCCSVAPEHFWARSLRFPDPPMVARAGLPGARQGAADGNEQVLLALKIFTRSVMKAIEGFCWLLSGLDVIVFAGRVGHPSLRPQHAGHVRV